jgi:hypothetical protein
MPEAAAQAAHTEIPAAAFIPISGKHGDPQRSTATLWIIASLALLASASIIAWRVRRSLPLARANASPARPVPDSLPSPVADGSCSAHETLAALKEQLFRLEADRLRGSISAADYASSKQALESSLRRQIG